MDHGISVEVVDGGHDSILEFLLRRDADVAQDGTGELGKEALDQIEPRAVLGRERERETACRLLGEPSLRLLGDVRRMIVEDHLDGGASRISLIEKFEELDELARAVAVLDEGVHLAGQEIDPGGSVSCFV